MADEMESEVCWGFLEMILPPEIKKGESEKVPFVPGSCLPSFLPSQNAAVVRL